MNQEEIKIFMSVSDEVRKLFHRLASIADQLHESAGIPASQRAVLETLQKSGSTTVPKIASEKGVSRQHIQIIVNQLMEKALLESVKNPSHRRSPLVQLTQQGKKTFAEINQREADLLTNINLPVDKEALHSSAQSLQALNLYFESSQWSKSSGNSKDY